MMWRLLLLLALGAVTAVSASATPPAIIKFGDKWTAADGEPHDAQLHVEWIDYDEQEDMFLRNPFVDEKRSTIRGKAFPLRAGEDEYGGGYIQADIAITASGNVGQCTPTQRGHHPELESHFCLFAKRNIKFHPALSHEGKRVAASGRFSISYESTTKLYMLNPPVGPDGVPQIDQREALPVEPVTLSNLGLTRAAMAEKWKSVVVFLSVNAAGTVTNCDFFEPTFVDAFDFALCNAALKIRFTPALDHRGRPRSDVYSLKLEP